MKQSNSGSRPQPQRRTDARGTIKGRSGKKSGGKKGRTNLDKRDNSKHGFSRSLKLKSWQKQLKMRDPKRFNRKVKGKAA